MKYDDLFNEGDLVQLKTGGPTMVVKSLVEDLLLCTWFEHGRTLHGTFSSRELCVAQARAPVWLDVLQRLSDRWPKVVATC